MIIWKKYFSRSLSNIVCLLYMLCFKVVISNSNTATLWRLNEEHTRIIEAKSSQFNDMFPMPQHSEVEQMIIRKSYDVVDSLFNIITTTEGENWTKQSSSIVATNKCDTIMHKHSLTYMSNAVGSKKMREHLNIDKNNENEDALNCGKPVNFTYYDHLIGVINRSQHPSIPEPEVALLFVNNHRNPNNFDLDDRFVIKQFFYDAFDLDTLEKRLKCAKKEKLKSVQLYNQIGNYWRIKGNAKNAIECFRQALAVSPNNAEALLNLARQLLMLHYLDDALYLTRRSLEVETSEKNTWYQYFTLGQIFKLYGHYQEASLHLRHSLNLNPGYAPAITALTEIESIPVATIHVYTLVIIICLCLGVLLVILSSVDNSVEQEELKPQRHFNKAMAMRQLRGLHLTAQKRFKKNVIH